MKFEEALKKSNCGKVKDIETDFIWDYNNIFYLSKISKEKNIWKPVFERKEFN